MATSDLGPCRGCGASMLWVVTAKGRRNPLNPEPDRERGNVLLCETEELARLYDVPIGRAVTLGLADAESERARGTDLYLSHFASCPQRGKFGKRGRAE